MHLFKRIFTKCPHTNKRMVNGDEIIDTIRVFRKPMIARVRCRDCGKTLHNVDLTDTPSYNIAS